MQSTDQASYFLKLFARGRYVSSRSIARRESNAVDKQQRHEERERFAVAAIAFCINNDQEFRNHFMNVIGESQRIAVARLEVEPKHWGDLVVVGDKIVVVLEFKLKALLGEHQDPTKSRFETSGYGAEIIREYGKGYQLRYVIVGIDIPQDKTKTGLPYRGLRWKEFIVKDRKESSLEHDLFDCLGVLGAPIFLTRGMKMKTLTSEVDGAMAVYKMLTAIAEDLSTKADSSTDSVGLEIRASGPTTARAKLLNEVVAPKRRALGWIGYELIDNNLRLSVWFYCSEASTKKVRQRLRSLAPGHGEIVDDGNSVGLQALAAKNDDHPTWFNRVLQSVAGDRA